MKICIYTTSMAKTGGIESHLVQFSQKLAKQGHKLTIVCANSRLNLNWEKSIREVAELRTAKVENQLFRIIWQICISLLLRTKKFDALYTNGQGSSVYWFAKGVGIQNWVHHHHMSADVSDQVKWSKYYRRSLSDCRKLIACAAVNASRLEEATGRPSDVIYCFSYQARSKKTYHTTNRRLRFGYFGRLIPAKGLQIIHQLSLDKHLNEIEWQIWGHGDDFDYSKFGQSESVNFHGEFSSEEELEDVLSKLDAFVLFSTFDEGLPICLLEAMGSGLPWIATDRGGIAELAQTSQDLILLSKTPDYNECKNACLLLADRIRNNDIDHDQLVRVYNKRFSDDALLTRWESCLKLTS